MRILVVGAGATGGYYGGRLHEAGRDVTFLVRDRRAEQIRSEGLRIISPGGNAHLHPKLLTAQQLKAEPCSFDLIVLTVKAYSLEDALRDIAPAVGPQTLLLPILNGLRHLDLLTERYGLQRVLAGTVRILADLTREGVIELLAPLTELTLGFLPGTVASDRARAEELKALLDVPGICLDFSGNVLAAMWRKWWLLASLNVVCILANGTIGDAVAVDRGEQFTHAVLDECMAVAAANGYPADADTEAEMRGRFSDRNSRLSSSMFRDLSRDRDVEADQILGDLIARAGSVPVPLITAAYVRLKVYEAQRSVEQSNDSGAVSHRIAGEGSAKIIRLRIGAQEEQRTHGIADGKYPRSQGTAGHADRAHEEVC